MLEQLELPPSARWTYTVSNYNVNILSLERGMFENNHSELNHTAAYSGQRNSLVIVNSVVWCYQREFVCVNVSPCVRRITEDMKAEIRLVPTFPNWWSEDLPQIKTLWETTQTWGNEERTASTFWGIHCFAFLPGVRWEDSCGYHPSVHLVRLVQDVFSLLA